MPKILIVGESLSSKDVESGQIFSGPSGWMLKDALASSGIVDRDCYKTNVFMFQPPGDLITICGAKADGIPGLPSLTKGKYCLSTYLGELRRLYQEINDVNPNLIIAMGSAAAWALCHTSGIKAIRGAFTSTHPDAGKALSRPLARQYKVLPTYNPAAIMRDYSLRPIFFSDLDKASRNTEFPEIRRPQREVWIEPSLLDMLDFEYHHITPAERLSIDIETKGDQVTCIGFAPSPFISLVVPFYSFAKKDGNYWPSLTYEMAAWRMVKRWCEGKPSVFQNGAYDMHRLWRTYGIHCRPAEDTMLLHHSLQPEMEKGLGFLATVYTEEASWKFMSKVETLKKED